MVKYCIKNIGIHKSLGKLTCCQNNTIQVHSTHKIVNESEKMWLTKIHTTHFPNLPTPIHQMKYLPYTRWHTIQNTTVITVRISKRKFKKFEKKEICIRVIRATL